VELSLSAIGVPRQAQLRVQTQWLGNIWFTKPLLGEPGDQRVIVVTSGRHAARVRYLTQVIWGPGYRVAVDSLVGEASTRPPEETARREAGLLAEEL
jgi:hypothetical protein